MTERRQLALVVEYSDLIAVLRNRRVALGISFDQLDETCGFARGTSLKMLSIPPADGRSRVEGKGRLNWRALGPRTLGKILDALGAALMVVEDRAALKQADYVARRESYVRKDMRMLPAGSIKLLDNMQNRENLAQMQLLRSAKVPPHRRRAIARQAARARWRKAATSPQSCQVEGK